jgi:selenium-binding protein 1
MVEQGLNGELLLNSKYGHQLHIWDLRKRRHVQALDLGAEQQMVLELRPAHDPSKAYGFVGVVVSLKDLSASIWLWHRENDAWAIRKVIEIPAEPADPDQLPPILKDFKAVPPLVSDINLSLDDRFLYVSCWGTGEMQQYDVSDPFNPKLTGSVHIGVVEVSRDGRRVYFSNSLYTPWDAQFYPEGIRGWVTKLDVNPAGGISFDPNFFVDFGAERTHQIRLQGGDASSDSYCYPNS